MNLKTFLKRGLLFTCGGMASLTAYAQSSPFVRQPALNHDASQIAFSYQGDIFVVASSGGMANRITAHQAHESNPKWSADSKKLAFASNRYGNDDIFVTNMQGNEIPTRLTFHSGNDKPLDFTKDGNVIFSARRYFVHLEREREIHSVSEKGGTSMRIIDALGDDAVVSPDGKWIAYVRGTAENDRYDYKEAAQKDIWLYDVQKKQHIQLTNYAGNDLFPKWSDSKTLYYTSSKDGGAFNLYKLQIDDAGKGGESQKITDYKADGVRYFDISRDGKSIVFERETDIYTLKTEANAQPQKVTISIPADFHQYPIEHKIYSSEASEYAISPNGKLLSLVVRGEIFVCEAEKDKSKTVSLTNNNPAYDRNVFFYNDSTVLYASDRNGQYDIFMVRSDDAKEGNIFKTLKHKTIQVTNTPDNEEYFILSPDSKKIAIRRGRGKLIVADISNDGKLANEKILVDGWAVPSGVSWSPDSKYLAYSLENLEFNEEIYIQPADNSSPAVNVSMHPRSDSSPIWSPDGSKLGFLSNRSNGETDVWFVWLRKVDWERTQKEWDEIAASKKDEKDKKDDKKKDIKPVQIDFEGIYERLVKVSSLPSNESNLAISKDGETFFFVNNQEGRAPVHADQDLYSIKWNGKDLKSLTSGSTNPSGVSIDAQGKNLYYLAKGGKITKFDISGSKGESIAFSAKMDIDIAKERMQIFNEAWRTLDEGFYDPKFHGKDWKKLGEKYRLWAEKATTERDFRDVLHMMFGELNASHMGWRFKEKANWQTEETGVLGIDIEPTTAGVKITRVIPDSPASRQQSLLKENEIITAVNGVAISPTMDFYSHFTNLSGEQVRLEVKNAQGVAREVVIRPTNDTQINNLLYEEWVSKCKELTNKYSNGRLGFIHIQGMDWESFERFESELMASGYGKEGIVIDVRYNGGGWTTDYLMTILTVRQHAYTVPRGAVADLDKENTKFKNYYPYSERLPFSAWTKPSITLCNESSYSNAEIFSYAYKTLGLGTLVGMPTFGAVISTGAKTLIDDSYVRLPFRAWYSTSTGKNMENNPATPDILLNNAPNSKAKGEDEQLKRAVEELLKQIEAKK